jgi:saccharopine dehydrogenase-like NADP-dependent oxidoreductase
MKKIVILGSGLVGALKTVIKQGIDIVDIAFSPEDAFELDDLAKKNKVTAVVDCFLTLILFILKV